MKLGFGHKLISCVTVICFTFSVFQSPAYSSSEAKNSEVSSTAKELSSFQLSKDLGRIEENYKGSGAQTVVLIRDAHDIPDAQKRIEQIIEVLTQSYGIKLVALEGAANELDPQIFKSFPDQKLLRQTLEHYFERGELAGGTAAAIFSKGVKFQGVENWDLYEEGIALFLKAMKENPKLEARIKSLETQLTQEKQKTYPKDFFEIDQLWLKFQDNQVDLISLLSFLSKFQSPVSEDLKLLIDESRKNANSQVDSEVREIAKKIEAHLKSLPSSGDVKSNLVRFNQKQQQFRTGRVDAKTFALTLKDLAHRYELNIPLSEALSGLAVNAQRMQAIEGSKLFKELDEYVRSVKAQFLQNPKEQELDSKTEIFRLLKRFTNLELDRNDWTEIKKILSVTPAQAGVQRSLDSRFSAKKRSEIRPDGLRLLSGERGNDEYVDVLSSMAAHIEFYKNTEQRDRVLLDNLNRAMSDASGDSAIFVAGGFHTESLTEMLKAKSISYILISPQIDSVPDNTHYKDHMRGEVSWKEYFETEGGKISPYKAFVRGVRSELTRDPEVLKSWRDQIIRDLAVSERISEAGNYTRFIDETAQNGTEKTLMARLDHFIDGLKNLQTEGKLNEQNVLQLLNTAKIETAFTGTAQLDSRAEVRQELMPLNIVIEDDSANPPKILSSFPVEAVGLSEVLVDSLRQLDRHLGLLRQNVGPISKDLLDHFEREIDAAEKRGREKSAPARFFDRLHYYRMELTALRSEARQAADQPDEATVLARTARAEARADLTEAKKRFKDLSVQIGPTFPVVSKALTSAGTLLENDLPDEALSEIQKAIEALKSHPSKEIFTRSIQSLEEFRDGLLRSEARNPNMAQDGIDRGALQSSRTRPKGTDARAEAREGQEGFQYDFGDEASDVLFFVTGKKELSQIEQYSKEYLKAGESGWERRLRFNPKGQYVRSKQKHEVKISGETYIFYSTENSGSVGKVYIEAEAKITKILFKRGLSAADSALFKVKDRLIMVQPAVDGSSFLDLSVEKSFENEEVMHAFGVALGRLHALGITHGDLTVRDVLAQGHIFVLKKKKGVRVAFIDFEFASPDVSQKGTRAEFKNIYQKLRNQLIYIRRLENSKVKRAFLKGYLEGNRSEARNPNMAQDGIDRGALQSPPTRPKETDARAEARVQRKSSKGPEDPNLPSFSDMENLLKKWNTVLHYARLGDIGYGLLLGNMERMSEYYKTYFKGLNFSRSKWPGSEKYNGIAFRSVIPVLNSLAAELQIPEEDLYTKFGFAKDSNDIVVVSETLTTRQKQDTLLEEVLHIVTAKVMKDLPIEVEEPINDLLVMSFSSFNNLNKVSLFYTDWSETERKALYNRYIIDSGNDPNISIHKIIKQVIEDLDEEKSIKIENQSIPIKDLFFRKLRTDLLKKFNESNDRVVREKLEYDLRQLWLVSTYSLHYVENLNEFDTFPLFPNWKLSLPESRSEARQAADQPDEATVLARTARAEARDTKSGGALKQLSQIWKVDARSPLNLYMAITYKLFSFGLLGTAFYGIYRFTEGQISLWPSGALLAGFIGASLVSDFYRNRYIRASLKQRREDAIDQAINLMIKEHEFPSQDSDVLRAYLNGGPLEEVIDALREIFPQAAENKIIEDLQYAKAQFEQALKASGRSEVRADIVDDEDLNEFIGIANSLLEELEFQGFGEGHPAYHILRDVMDVYTDFDLGLIDQAVLRRFVKNKYESLISVQAVLEALVRGGKVSEVNVNWLYHALENLNPKIGANRSEARTTLSEMTKLIDEQISVIAQKIKDGTIDIIFGNQTIRTVRVKNGKSATTGARTDGGFAVNHLIRNGLAQLNDTFEMILQDDHHILLEENPGILRFPPRSEARKEKPEETQTDEKIVQLNLDPSYEEAYKKYLGDRYEANGSADLSQPVVNDVFLLVKGKEVLGFSTFSMDYFSYQASVFDIETAPSARRQGVGTQLWNAVRDYAVKQGARTLIIKAILPQSRRFWNSIIDSEKAAGRQINWIGGINAEIVLNNSEEKVNTELEEKDAAVKWSKGDRHQFNVLSAILKARHVKNNNAKINLGKLGFVEYSREMIAWALIHSDDKTRQEAEELYGILYPKDIRAIDSLLARKMNYLSAEQKERIRKRIEILKQIRSEARKVTTKPYLDILQNRTSVDGRKVADNRNENGEVYIGFNHNRQVVALAEDMNDFSLQASDLVIRLTQFQDGRFSEYPVQVEGNREFLPVGFIRAIAEHNQMISGVSSSTVVLRSNEQEGLNDALQELKSLLDDPTKTIGYMEKKALGPRWDKPATPDELVRRVFERLNWVQDLISGSSNYDVNDFKTDLGKVGNLLKKTGVVDNFLHLPILDILEAKREELILGEANLFDVLMEGIGYLGVVFKISEEKKWAHLQNDPHFIAAVQTVYTTLNSEGQTAEEIFEFVGKTLNQKSAERSQSAGTRLIEALENRNSAEGAPTTDNPYLKSGELHNNFSLAASLFKKIAQDPTYVAKWREGQSKGLFWTEPFNVFLNILKSDLVDGLQKRFKTNDKIQEAVEKAFEDNIDDVLSTKTTWEKVFTNLARSEERENQEPLDEMIIGLIGNLQDAIQHLGFHDISTEDRNKWVAEELKLIREFQLGDMIAKPTPHPLLPYNGPALSLIRLNITAASSLLLQYEKNEFNDLPEELMTLLGISLVLMAHMQFEQKPLDEEDVKLIIEQLNEYIRKIKLIYDRADQKKLRMDREKNAEELGVGVFQLEALGEAGIDIETLQNLPQLLVQLSEFLGESSVVLQGFNLQAQELYEWLDYQMIPKRRRSLPNNRDLEREALNQFQPFQGHYLEQIVPVIEVLDQASRLLYSLKTIQATLEQLGTDSKKISRVVQSKRQLETAFQEAESEYRQANDHFRRNQGAYVDYLNALVDPRNVLDRSRASKTRSKFPKFLEANTDKFEISVEEIKTADFFAIKVPTIIGSGHSQVISDAELAQMDVDDLTKERNDYYVFKLKENELILERYAQFPVGDPVESIKFSLSDWKQAGLFPVFRNAYFDVTGDGSSPNQTLVIQRVASTEYKPFQVTYRSKSTDLRSEARAKANEYDPVIFGVIVDQGMFDDDLNMTSQFEDELKMIADDAERIQSGSTEELAVMIDAFLESAKTIAEAAQISGDKGTGQKHLAELISNFYFVFGAHETQLQKYFKSAGKNSFPLSQKLITAMRSEARGHVIVKIPQIEGIAVEGLRLAKAPEVLNPIILGMTERAKELKTKYPGAAQNPWDVIAVVNFFDAERTVENGVEQVKPTDFKENSRIRIILAPVLIETDHHAKELTTKDLAQEAEILRDRPGYSEFALALDQNRGGIFYHFDSQRPKSSEDQDLAIDLAENEILSVARLLYRTLQELKQSGKFNGNPDQFGIWTGGPGGPEVKQQFEEIFGTGPQTIKELSLEGVQDAISLKGLAEMSMGPWNYSDWMEFIERTKPKRSEVREKKLTGEIIKTYVTLGIEISEQPDGSIVVSTEKRASFHELGHLPSALTQAGWGKDYQFRFNPVKDQSASGVMILTIEPRSLLVRFHNLIATSRAEVRAKAVNTFSGYQASYGGITYIVTDEEVQEIFRIAANAFREKYSGAKFYKAGFDRFFEAWWKHGLSFVSKNNWPLSLKEFLASSKEPAAVFRFQELPDSDSVSDRAYHMLTDSRAETGLDTIFFVFNQKGALESFSVYANGKALVLGKVSSRQSAAAIEKAKAKIARTPSDFIIRFVMKHAGVQNDILAQDFIVMRDGHHTAGELTEKSKWKRLRVENSAKRKRVLDGIFSKFPPGNYRGRFTRVEIVRIRAGISSETLRTAFQELMERLSLDALGTGVIDNGQYRIERTVTSFSEPGQDSLLIEKMIDLEHLTTEDQARVIYTIGPSLQTETGKAPALVSAADQKTKPFPNGHDQKVKALVASINQVIQQDFPSFAPGEIQDAEHFKRIIESESFRQSKLKPAHALDSAMRVEQKKASEGWKMYRLKQNERRLAALVAHIGMTRKSVWVAFNEINRPLPDVVQQAAKLSAEEKLWKEYAADLAVFGLNLGDHYSARSLQGKLHAAAGAKIKPAQEAFKHLIHDGKYSELKAKLKAGRAEARNIDEIFSQISHIVNTSASKDDLRAREDELRQVVADLNVDELDELSQKVSEASGLQFQSTVSSMIDEIIEEFKDRAEARAVKKIESWQINVMEIASSIVRPLREAAAQKNWAGAQFGEFKETLPALKASLAEQVPDEQRAFELNALVDGLVTAVGSGKADNGSFIIFWNHFNKIIGRAEARNETPRHLHDLRKAIGQAVLMYPEIIIPQVLENEKISAKERELLIRYQNIGELLRFNGKDDAEVSSEELRNAAKELYDLLSKERIAEFKTIFQTYAPKDENTQDRMELLFNSLDRTALAWIYAADLSGEVTSKPEEFNLDQMLKSIVGIDSNLEKVVKIKNLIAGQAQDNASGILRLLLVQNTIVTDRLSFFKVVMNLIRNAYDALGEKYDIVGMASEAKIILEVKLSDDLKYLILNVSDNGKGIKPEVIRHVFDEGFTTKGANGSGLGLAIVKQIVEDQLGGNIKATSEYGKSTTFSIQIPVSKLSGASEILSLPETQNQSKQRRAEVRDQSEARIDFAKTNLAIPKVAHALIQNNGEVSLEEAQQVVVYVEVKGTDNLRAEILKAFREANQTQDISIVSEIPQSVVSKADQDLVSTLLEKGGIVAFAISEKPEGWLIEALTKLLTKDKIERVGIAGKIPDELAQGLKRNGVTPTSVKPNRPIHDVEQSLVPIGILTDQLDSMIDQTFIPFRLDLGNVRDVRVIDFGRRFQIIAPIVAAQLLKENPDLAKSRDQLKAALLKRFHEAGLDSIIQDSPDGGFIISAVAAKAYLEHMAEIAVQVAA